MPSTAHGRHSLSLTRNSESAHSTRTGAWTTGTALGASGMHCTLLPAAPAASVCTRSHSHAHSSAKKLWARRGGHAAHCAHLGEAA